MSVASRLQPVVDFVNASSKGDERWGVFVDQALNAAPTAVQSPHVPIYLSTAQGATVTLPSNAVDPPVNQQSVGDRLRHLIWLAQDGRFDVAILGLGNESDTLQDVLDADAPTLNLSNVPCVFVPLYLMEAKDRAWAELRLPLVPTA